MAGRALNARSLAAALVTAGIAAAAQTPHLPTWASQSDGVRLQLAAEGVDADAFADLVEQRRVLTQRRPLAAGEGGAHVAALAFVAAPVDVVWQAVADCARLPEFMPHFVACEDIQPDAPLPPGTRWNRNRLEFGVFPARFRIDLVVEATLEPPTRLRWRRIRGDTRRNEGYWHLIPVDPRGVILVYDTSTDAGAVPDFVQRALTTRDLPGSVEAVRRRSESAP